MQGFRLLARKISFFMTVFFLSISSVSAATIDFSGQLDVISLDTGGGVYSGVPLGTNFSGFIDDVSGNGAITDGTTMTSFDCCIAAGSLSVENDFSLSASDAVFLNGVLGSSLFSSGDVLDGINIEGDTITADDTRIEIGLSYIFAGDTFLDDSLSNYPFNPDDVLLGLFFIFEENDITGEAIYSAVGGLDPAPNPVPVPAAVWLFGTALIGLVGFGKRKASIAA